MKRVQQDFYDAVHARFVSGKVATAMTYYDITHTELMQRANELGYSEPKWYQFWIRPISIYVKE
jgi:hypothetical protein